MSLLLSIAYGWTLTIHNGFDCELICEVGISEIWSYLSIFAFSFFDSEEKHHDYEGFKGFGIIIGRSVLFIYFLKFFLKTNKQLWKN